MGCDAADSINHSHVARSHRYYGAHELRFIICSCYHRFLCVLEQTRKRYRFVVSRIRIRITSHLRHQSSKHKKRNRSHHCCPGWMYAI